jgi:hypothetical protein
VHENTLRPKAIHLLKQVACVRQIEIAELRSEIMKSVMVRVQSVAAKKISVALWQKLVLVIEIWDYGRPSTAALVVTSSTF